MKRYIIPIIAFVFLINSSCEINTKRFSSTGLTVTGNIGEILVVCDKAIWESEIKSHLDTNLTQWIMPYFPDVATFELVHKTPSHFDIAIVVTLHSSMDQKSILDSAPYVFDTTGKVAGAKGL